MSGSSFDFPPSAIHQNIPADFKNPSIGSNLFPIASIIKVPPEPTSTDKMTFNDLVCNQEDVDKITHLITVMGENGKLVLLFKYKSELTQIGRDIDHVHPLKFITVVVTNPYLKECMQNIRKDHFKWSNFISGIGDGLSAQEDIGNVSRYLSDFASAVNANPRDLKKFVNSRDWEKMIEFLIYSD